MCQTLTVNFDQFNNINKLDGVGPIDNILNWIRMNQ